MSARKAVGVGAVLEIELASGRMLEVQIEFADGQWATLPEFLEALDLAKKVIAEPIEE